MSEQKRIGMQNLVIDIDDHLIIYPDKKFDDIMDKYRSGVQNTEEINLLNKLFKLGYRVILWTGRNWEKYDFTKKQLKEFGIKHNELLMGKPQGVYVDVDSIKSLKELK